MFSCPYCAGTKLLNGRPHVEQTEQLHPNRIICPSCIFLTCWLILKTGFDEEVTSSTLAEVFTLLISRMKRSRWGVKSLHSTLCFLPLLLKCSVQAWTAHSNCTFSTSTKPARVCFYKCSLRMLYTVSVLFSVALFYSYVRKFSSHLTYIFCYTLNLFSTVKWIVRLRCHQQMNKPTRT